jgi:hypothetical protein
MRSIAEVKIPVLAAVPKTAINEPTAAMILNEMIFER